MKTNESGRSMIEMLGVLAIIGALSIGGIAGYSKAMGKYRVNKTIDQITQIVSGVRVLFNGHKSYSALSAELIAKAHIYPGELGDGVASNPFGGNVTLTSAKRNDNDTRNKAFTITYTAIPDEACIDLATQDWGTGTRSGLVSVAVNGNITQGSSLSVAGATAKCNRTNGNVIALTFY